LAGRTVNAAIPAIWVAGGVGTSHTGIRCCQFTGDMFGATNPTCDDSPELHCDRNAAVGKVSIRDKASVEHRRMKKRPVAISGRAASPPLRPSRLGPDAGRGGSCVALGPGPRAVLSWRRKAAAAGPGATAARVPELVFAPVRPGFVAACMVVAADGRRRPVSGYRGSAADGDRRPERPSPRLRPAPWRGRGRLFARSRRANQPDAALRSPAVPLLSMKRTNGIFYPGGGCPSRRCSAQCGYRGARAWRGMGPGIDYFR
jgi:hypothetical protein